MVMTARNSGGSRPRLYAVACHRRLKKRLFDLAHQEQRSADANQSMLRRDPQRLIQSLAGVLDTDHIATDSLRNHARIGGAGAGDSGNDNLTGRWEKNLANLADRFIGHRAENDCDWNRVKMLVEKIAQRPRSGGIMRSVQQDEGQ